MLMVPSIFAGVAALRYHMPKPSACASSRWLRRRNGSGTRPDGDGTGRSILRWLIYATILTLSLVSGVATARIAYYMARHPDQDDRRTMSERQLAIAVWLLPVVGFVLGAILPWVYFVARNARQRGEENRL